MPRRKKINEDDDWEVSPKAKKTSRDCIICSTDSAEKLTQLSSIESWLTLFNAAKIREHKELLDIAEKTKDNEIPSLQYHRSCRCKFTNKVDLERIVARYKAREEKLQKAFEEENENTTNDQFPLENRKSQRQLSNEGTSKTTLPVICIFCQKVDKYKKNSRSKEKLSSCMQLRADTNIRAMATKKNDTKILTITCDELIAKEAVYHFTCYRDYTRQDSKTEKENDVAESKNDGFKEVLKMLVELYEKPKVMLLEELQQQMKTVSGKKNLKRRISNNTEDYRFINYKNNVLVYPNSLNIEDIIISNYNL